MGIDYIPWSAGILFDEGRLGTVSIHGSSTDRQAALDAAHDWHRFQQQQQHWDYTKPSCVIYIGVPWGRA
jgi:hypothetical protein